MKKSKLFSFSMFVNKRIAEPFQQFFQTERRSGILLMIATIVSLGLANSVFSDIYIAFWHSKIGFLGFNGHNLILSIEHWINDGLMSIFFLVIGLEMKRELTCGELSSVKKAVLPMFAAVGGMLFPALIFSVIVSGTSFSSAWGIPMATDIAFALGILSLLGNRVPLPIKVLLTALAVVDDLGAIIVIAVFYTDNISFSYLGFAICVFSFMLLLNRFRVSNFLIYVLFGLLLWYFMLLSGLHSTLAGVLTAIAIPNNMKFMKADAEVIGHRLHKLSSYLIMPFFAMANTAIPLNFSISELFSSPLNYGIMFGLLLGKPLGIVGFSVLAIKLRWAILSSSVCFRHILGVGFLGGVGFTMSIFISMLAIDSEQYRQFAKISILIGSLLSGIVGYLILKKGFVCKTEDL